jgi:hypothetical protein
LFELETQGAFQPPIAAPSSGTFPAPYEAYQWEITVGEALQWRGADEPFASEVVLVISRSEGGAPILTMSAIWPAQWVSSP